MADSHAGIPDLQKNPLPPASRTNQDAAIFCIANGVGQEIAQHALQQLRIRHDAPARRHMTQAQLLGGGVRLMQGNDTFNDCLQINGFHRQAGITQIDARNIEQSVQLFIEYRHRTADQVDQMSLRGVAGLRVEFAGKQHQGVERLT